MKTPQARQNFEDRQLHDLLPYVILLTRNGGSAKVNIGAHLKVILKFWVVALPAGVGVMQAEVFLYIAN